MATAVKPAQQSGVERDRMAEAQGAAELVEVLEEAEARIRALPELARALKTARP
jgi:hypothetical protein